MGRNNVPSALLRALLGSILLLPALDPGARADERELRVRELVKAFSADDAEARRKAQDAVVAEGSAAIPVLRVLLQAERDPEVAGRLRESIGRIQFDELSNARWTEIASVQPLDSRDWTKTSLSPDGALLASVGYDGRLVVWDVRAGRLAWVADDCSAHPNLDEIHFSSDGRHLVLARGEWAQAWEVGTWKPVEWKSITKMGDGWLGTSPELAVFLAKHRIMRTPCGVRVFGSGEKPPPSLAVYDQFPGSGQYELQVRLFDPENKEMTKGGTWTCKLEGASDLRGHKVGIDLMGLRVGVIQGGKLAIFEAKGGEAIQTVGRDVTAVNFRGSEWVTGHANGEIRAWKPDGSSSLLGTGSGNVYEIQTGDSLALALVTNRPQVSTDALLLTSEVVRTVRNGWKSTLRGDIAVLVDSRQLEVWQEGRLALTIETEQREPSGWDFCGDVFAVRWGAATLFFDLAAKCSLPSAVLHRDEVRGLAWTRKGLLVHGKDEARLLDPATGLAAAAGNMNDAVMTSEGPRTMEDLGIQRCGAIVVSPDGRAVVFETDEALVVRRGDGLAVESRLPPLPSDGRVLALAPLGSRLATVDDDDVLRMWEVDSCAEVLSVNLGPGQGSEVQVEFSPDGRTLAFAGHQGVRFFDSKGKERPSPARVPKVFGAPAARFAFSPDGSFAVVVHSDVRLVDLTRDAPDRVFQAGPDGIDPAFLQVSPDGSSFITASRSDTWIDWYSVESGTAVRLEIERWTGHSGLVDFLPGGHLVVAEREAVRIYDNGSRRPAGSLDIWEADFVRASPDGRRVSVAHGSWVTIYERR
ncbi:MAG: hypothetical protein FD180_4360 [Planctomycetota bacterium]|nr:MAG: hypothetical protein FD180_4360 [Planctomycetota bacterium]